MEPRKLTLTYLEFYSGVGGWTMALRKACRDLQDHIDESDSDTIPIPIILETKLLQAFDNSHLANHVFSHNFKTFYEMNGNPKKTKKKNKKRSAPTSSSSTSPTPTSTTSKTFAIEKLSIRHLTTELPYADIWAMSPPCQPHTRNNVHNKDVNDPRSKSFLHLCSLIETLPLDNLPFMIVLENVVGFESSQSFNIWSNALGKRDYFVGHFHLSPDQVGIPNTRPRYYCIAIRKILHSDRKKLKTSSEGIISTTTNNDDCSDRNERETHLVILRDIILHSTKYTDITQLPSRYLQSSNHHVENTYNNDDGEGDNNQKDKELEKQQQQQQQQQQKDWITTSIPELNVTSQQTSYDNDDENSTTNTNKVNTISKYLDDDLLQISLGNNSTTQQQEVENNNNNNNNSSALHQQRLQSLRVPPKLLQKNASWCFDIVTPSDCRSSCFTHSYGRFIRGTGSTLYMIPFSSDSKKDKDANTTTINNNNNTNDSVKLFELQEPSQRQFDKDWNDGLDLENQLRFFSGTELARLMGFPVPNKFFPLPSLSTETGDATEAQESNDKQHGNCFEFPPDATPQQQWKLLGNSLNVHVASKIVELGLIMTLTL